MTGRRAAARAANGVRGLVLAFFGLVIVLVVVLLGAWVWAVSTVAGITFFAFIVLVVVYSVLKAVSR